MVSGPDGPTLGGCVRKATAAKHEGWVERHNPNLHSEKQWRSLRIGHTLMVKACEFSSQIPPLQTTGREERQCRRIIHNIFKVWTKAFLKSTSCFLKNSLFFAELHVPHNDTYNSWCYPKKLSVRPCIVHLALLMLNRFIYIAAELYIWPEKYTPSRGCFKWKL